MVILVDGILLSSAVKIVLYYKVKTPTTLERPANDDKAICL